MSSFDLSQAQRHIELLRGNKANPVHFQCFVDDKSVGSDTAKEFYGELDRYASYLAQMQSSGMGIYITVNPTNGQGRKESDLTSIDWCFADFDNIPLPQSLPLTPLFITQRDTHHSHLYWPICGCEDAAEYRALQRRIALYLGADQQVIDPTRVLRLAGTQNLKDPNNPMMYYITQDNSGVLGDDFAYTPDEIVNAFVLPADKEIELKNWIENRKSIDDGSGYNDSKIYRDRLIKFLTENAEPAIKGAVTGRSYTVIKVMSMAHDLGIPLEEAQQIGWEYYNPRIQPPYTDYERDRKFNKYVERAYKYANNAVGCRTAGGVFMALGEVKEPVNGWDGNAESAPEPELEWKEQDAVSVVTEFGYMTEEQAAINAVSITNKSPILDIAFHFIGMNYPNKTLLRHEKVFYAYNGRCYDVVDEDDVRAEIVRFLAQWKFPPSKISQIFTTVSDIAQTQGLEQGMWLNGSNRNGKDTVVVKNGLLEVQKDSVELLPHTRDFFMLNSLDYDYDPTATCPEWMTMLERIWPNDPDTQNMLQEWFGYNLIVDNRFDFYAQFIGKSRAGKGTITSVLTKMIGEHNITSPNIEGIIQDHIVHNMSVARSAIIPEANAVHHNVRDRVLNQLKSMTGGDTIEFNRKYKSAATGRDWAKITISSNSMPEFIDSSGALVNRALIFPFYNTFAGKEDRGLKKRLYAEVAGILNWSIKGLIRLMRNGKFTKSVRSEEVKDDMRYDTFPLAAFVEHSCDIVAGSMVTVDELYKQYLYFCDVSDTKNPLSSYKFSRYLKDSSLPVMKCRDTSGSRKYVFTGIQIKPDAKKPQFTNVMPINPTVKIPM